MLKYYRVARCKLKGKQVIFIYVRFIDMKEVSNSYVILSYNTRTIWRKKNSEFLFKCLQDRFDHVELWESDHWIFAKVWFEIFEKKMLKEFIFWSERITMFTLVNVTIWYFYLLVTFPLTFSSIKQKFHGVDSIFRLNIERMYNNFFSIAKQTMWKDEKSDSRNCMHDLRFERIPSLLKCQIHFKALTILCKNIT